jgi:two-component system, cell cycle sensor histidine kinase and response regulator CckA
MAGLIAGLLQLIIPSYAFRLVRRFGAERVGWFVVGAFVVLSLMHLLAPIKISGADPGIPVEWVFMAGSVLLLVGLGHLDTRLGEREKVHSKEESLQRAWEQKLAKATADLVKTNRALTEKIALHQEREATLTQAAARYQTFFNGFPEPVWVFDLRTMRLIGANDASLRLYGFTLDQMLGISAPELCCPELRDAFQQDSTKPCRNPSNRGVWKICRNDGVVVEVEITALDLKLGDLATRLIRASDVKVRAQNESSLRRAERLESIRQLSAAVAARFGPVFESIEQYITEVSSRMQNPIMTESLKRASTAATRGQNVRRQLLSMAGQLPIQVEAIEINDLIRSLHRSLVRLVGDGIKLETSFGACMTPMLADARVIELIIFQLVNNAREAMPKGGIIKLSTATVNVDPNCANQSSGVKQYVRLSVRDSGRGIPADAQCRVFEPAFTEGSGRPGSLGLAAVHGLSRQHSGWIELESEPGSGAEFRLFLPCAPVSATQSEGATSRLTPVARETIMLVEEDDKIRALARFVLNREGYRLVEADSTFLALTLWESQGAKVDLLLTSLTFGSGISGLELAAELQSRNPGLITLFSGEAETQSGSPAGSRFLSKPYTPAKLLREVEAALPEPGRDE